MNRSEKKKVLRAHYRAEYGDQWYENPEIHAKYKADCKVRGIAQKLDKQAAQQAEQLALRTAIQEVMTRHTATRHALEGGTGISGFLWVNGLCFSSNCLTLSSGLDADLEAIDGYRSHKFNLD